VVEWRVISIGAMDAHPEWGERSPVRTAHATTTLVRSGGRTILVDPSLPSPVMEARLGERAGLKPADVTDVFLTSFRPDVRRGLSVFENARWLISETEREAVGVAMIENLKRAHEQGDHDIAQTLAAEVESLKRCEVAPDTLVDRVDLFPMPGVTPGLTGLVIAEPRHTTLIAGDAIATVEHLAKGQVVRWSVDVSKARESFAEAIEIADMLVLGRDNAVVNPTKRPF